MIARRQTFSRTEHLRRRRDFQEIYAGGARVKGRHMTVFTRPTARPEARLGVAVTRKVGSAVRRNRVKRLIREIFRTQKPAPGVDVVVVARPSAAGQSKSDLESDYRTTLARGRIRFRGHAPLDPARTAGGVQ